MKSNKINKHIENEFVEFSKKAVTSLNTALAHRHICSSVTGGAFGREVHSSDNLLCAGSLVQERYKK